MQRFFNDQAARVNHRFLLAIPAERWDVHTKAEADDFDEMPPVPPTAEEVLPEDEKQRLWLALLPYLLSAIHNSASLAGEIVGVSDLVGQDPRIAELLKESGTRIAGIHRTTLNAVRTALADGISRGYSARQIAYGVPEDDFRGLHDTVTETYKGRALTIAQNEIANARALTSAEMYQEAGVRMVYITDGPSCGWLTHNSGDSAAGSIRTLIEYRQTPYSHPNCQRVAVPIMGR